RRLPLRRLVRLGVGLLEFLDPEPTLREAQVIDGARVFGKFLGIDDVLKLLDRAVLVSVGSLEQAQSQTVASGDHFLVIAVTPEELPETADSKRVAFLVIGAAGAGQHHVRSLIRFWLRPEPRSPYQQGGQRREENPLAGS